MPYIIERDSANVGEEGVRVYVVDLDDDIPGYSIEVGRKVYSSTSDPDEATVFYSRHGATELADNTWRDLNPRVVGVLR